MTNQPRRWAIRRAFAVGVYLLLVATACRDDASAANTTAPTELPVFSVEHVVTAAFEGLTTVTGYLFAPDNQPVQICSALTESNPPQCETPALVVQGFDIETLHGWSASGGGPTANTVIWTADPIEITGRISSGVLTVRSTNPDSSTSLDDTPQVPTPTSETEDTP